MSRLVFQQVRKTYPGGIVAVDGVDLTVDSGELFAIVGPSGSGKSTLLRLIAGLESLDEGAITLDGRRIDVLAPRDRDVAMVFQGQVLYPHLNVFENIAFGLRARKRPRAEADASVRQVAATLGLAGCLDRAIATLSGGQRQRVALGRAMVLHPRVFLLDEPFSGLDAPLRVATRSELGELRKRIGATMVMVTHDQSEAMALGDRIAVLDRGKVVQVGTPQAIYDRPANRFVAGFIGHPPMNILPALVARQGVALEVRILGIDHFGPFLIPRSVPDIAPIFDHATPRVDLGLRAEHVTLAPCPADAPGHATVLRLEPTGPSTLATVAFGPHRVASWVKPHSSIRLGDRVDLEFDWDHARWFDAETGKRLGVNDG